MNKIKQFLKYSSLGFVALVGIHWMITDGLWLTKWICLLVVCLGAPVVCYGFGRMLGDAYTGIKILYKKFFKKV